MVASMWFLSEDSVELLRSAPLLLFVLCLGTVTAKHDFPVYRMQHFDLHGVHFGSRSAAVNMEMRGEGVTILNRKCVIVRWAWLTPDRFLDLVHKGAGSILILLPVDWRNVSDHNTIDTWVEVEERLLAMDVPIPVYFATETDELADIHTKMAAGADSEWGSSAAAALLTAVAGQGYQAVTDASDPVVLQHHEVVSFVGKLGGVGSDRDLPTVAIVTHYDSFGLAPTLSTGPDSNGSGVAALLELARLFSLLYADPHTKPSYNLMFVLTGGGHLSYFGTKYFIEDMLEDDDSFLLSKADYVLCLDSIAATNSSDLFIHLSRPPTNTSRAHHLLQHVNMSAAMFAPSIRVNIVHKKVRIGAGEELVAWEHERFSLRRIPAATLSNLPHHTEPRRKAMFSQAASPQAVATTVQVLAEGIARHIMDLPSHQDNATPIFSGGLSVKEQYVGAWLGLLSNTPRSPQLLGRDHPLLTSLEETLSKYVDEVTKFSHSPADKSDPEYVLYSVPSTTMHVHSVKPAVFDLVLALSIASYSALVYLLVGHFTKLLQLLAPLLALKIKTE